MSDETPNADPTLAAAQEAAGTLQAQLRARLGSLKSAARESDAGFLLRGLGTGPLPPAPEPEAPTEAERAAVDRAETQRLAAERAEADELESRKRMAFILAWVKKSSDDPIFQRKEVVYKVLAEERAHQQGLLAKLVTEFKQLPPPAAAMGLTPEEIAEHPIYRDLEARRSAMQGEIDQMREVQTRLFNLQKGLTGSGNKTGGTGILAKAAPEDAGSRSSREAIDMIGDWLSEN
ncbi:MAG: hypothetical protein JWM80_5812 [Cyanobacteria bacterium RYN_339]|nr:hypothetical protein [Cyanobacteria bacterium RYN_339]